MFQAAGRGCRVGMVGVVVVFETASRYEVKSLEFSVLTDRHKLLSSARVKAFFLQVFR